MEDNKKVKVLLKVFKKIYDEKCEIYDRNMCEIGTFYFTFFAAVFFIMG